MRYRTVLFDLDGTLIDSGAIILASFRHATRTVLAREIPDDELVAAVGGSSIHDQMRAFDPDRVDELVRVYREHNTPLHDELEAFPGVHDLLERLQAGGRRARDRHREAPEDRPARLRSAGNRAILRRGRDHRRHRPAQTASRAGAPRARAPRHEPADGAFVGDSPFDVQAGKAAGVFTVGVSWGKIHPPERLLELGADTIVHSPEELLDVL